MVKKLGDGVSAGTAAVTSGAADIVVLAVMWPDVPRAVEGLAWDGRIVLDPPNDFDAGDLNGRTSSEVVADLVAPARVVKAGTRGRPHRSSASDRPAQSGRAARLIFLSGDDAEAKSPGRRAVPRGRRLRASSSISVWAT